MHDAPKAVWSIPYVSVAFFQSLKQNFIAYRSSKVSWRPDCIFEIYQLWQSDFSRVYSNCCCSCSFEAEIIKIGQSSHKMYSNNILNSQESTTILNAWTKKGLETYWRPHVYASSQTATQHITPPQKKKLIQLFSSNVCIYKKTLIYYLLVIQPFFYHCCIYLFDLFILSDAWPDNMSFLCSNYLRGLSKYIGER